MFIAMNRFRVKKGSEDAFEKVWLGRDSYLDSVPGFLEFHLLKGPEHEDFTLYSSHTVWQSKAALPRYLLRDRDKSYGPAFRHRVRAMGITEVITAPRSPWQNPYVERFIGSIRRECLDHVIVLSAAGLQRVVQDYVTYYMRSRTHLSLDKD